MAAKRTLWEEGRSPGRLIVVCAALAALTVVALNLVGGTLGLFFDVTFVLICVASALAVRPRDFFVVGVLPPLLMAATVTLLAIVARSSVAKADDGLFQAIVSGLAHRSTALLIGYALALAVLGIRKLALRNAGNLVPSHKPMPRQRAASSAARMSRRSSGGSAKISDSSAVRTDLASG